VRRALLALLSVCLPLVAMSAPGGAASAPAAPSVSVQVSGVGVGMYPAFREDVERYAITTTAATAGAVTVGVTASDPTSEVRINGLVAPGGTRTIEGLQPGDEVAVFVSDSAATRTYSLVYLPAGFPTLRRDSSVGSDTPSPGMVLLTLAVWTQPSPFFEAAVDANGVPVYVAGQQSSIDLKRLPNGHYSAARGTGTGAGSDIVELDEQFRELARYRTVGLVDTDGHDSILLPDGSRYLLAYEPDSSSGKTDAVIQHIGPGGEVLFEWDSEDHVDIASETMVPSTTADYAHVNSIEIMSDGDLLVSFRNLSSVFKIARSKHDGFDVGDVVWRLGGRHSDFTFVDTEGAADGGPCAQHTATELANGDIMVFDNGAWAPDPLCVDPANPAGAALARPLSRVAVWSPDTSTGVATMVTDISMGSRFALFAGSAQALPDGNILIGWASSTNAVASEVDEAGNLHWELVAEGTPKYFTYRASKTDVPDRIPPRVSVAAPAEGAVIAQGASVQPGVECTDRGGSSLRTCTAPAVDTSTPGTRVYTATARDGAGNQTTVQRSYVVTPAPTTVPAPGPPPALQPDAMIRKAGSRPFRGQDVYGVMSGQRAKATSGRDGETTTAVVRIQNDGDVADRFTIRRHASASTFKVRLRLPDGARTSPLLAPGESWTVRIRVTRTHAVEPGDVLQVRTVARSVTDTARRDAVWLRVRAR
jgi:hypothetical protein